MSTKTASLFVMLFASALAACGGGSGTTKSDDYSRRQLATFQDQKPPEWVAQFGTQRCFEKDDWFFCVELESIPHGADPNAGIDSAIIKSKARISQYLNQSINAIEQRMSEGYGYSSKDLKLATNTASQVINKQGIVPRGSFWILTEERSGPSVTRNYDCYALVGMDIAKAAGALEGAVKRLPEPKMGVSKEMQIKADDLQSQLMAAAAAAY